ncbi:rhomboid family intramembrane serine protease [Salinibius halmophilus]|uniref:rhomboid family intramembrane serine protease n=1 Tax=Salinibius halmophilus TaxID=1853216 RepID=UPI000E66F7F0|nr:rhomboid family intramembrane serine protease [Salinibius halmophilus]
MLSLFKVRPGYVLTPIIMWLCVAAYLVVIAFTGSFIWFSAYDLARLGANYGPAVIEGGQWWRLLSAMFLHGGAMHIFFNLVVLANIGMLLEPVIGRWFYGAIYLVTGIIASLASIVFSYGAVSVGASGAIFGLYGCFLGLLLGKFFSPEATKQMLRGTLAFIAINVAIGFMIPQIDNAAHLGGAISGFILGIVMIPVVAWRLRRATPPPDSGDGL